MIFICVLIGVLASDDAIFHNFIYFIANKKEQMYSLHAWNEHFKRIFNPEIIIFFIILTPFSLSLFEERKSKTTNIICIRQPFKIYLIKKIVAVAITATLSYLLYTFLSFLIFVLIEYFEKGYITTGFAGRIYWYTPHPSQKNMNIWLDQLSFIHVLIIGALIFSVKAALYGILAVVSSYYFKYDKYLVIIMAYIIYLCSRLMSLLTPTSITLNWDDIPPLARVFLAFREWFTLDLVYVVQGIFDVLPHIIGIAVLLVISLILYMKIDKSEVID